MSAASEEQVEAQEGFRLPSWLSVAVVRDYGVVLAFIALFVTLSLSSSAFLTSANLKNLAFQATPVGIIAAGGTLVFIADEPTRGVDVGAKTAIYALIKSLAAEGIAVLLISSEHEEVLGLAHRVLVMKNGRIAAEFGREEMNEDAVLHAAFGTQVALGASAA